MALAQKQYTTFINGASSAITSGFLTYDTAAQTSQYNLTPSIGFVGGIQDPLSYLTPQAKPHVETPEEWLRRRVRETCWKAA